MLRDPLPLSLDPLEDESLPGYLLRLSHRLEHTPARVMFLTGLTVTDRSEARPRLSSMVHLDADTAAVFSTAARLTPSETAALCLSAFEERYPYAAPAFADKARTMDGRKVIRTERWLFTTSTRYCPQCLASNGSTIQNEHGGAWRRSWRLPPVFACMRQRVFLEHLCPVCQQPVHFAPGSGARLLPRIKDHRLHPLQCRTTLPTLERPFDPPSCGTRLDTTASVQGPPPAHEQLVLQERLAALLRPDGPGTAQSLGEPIPPEQYFTQIRWLTSLLSLTWPAGSDLVSSTTSSDESRACAGFLEAAVRITDQHSPAEAIDLLRPVLLSMGDLGWKTVWGRRYLLDQPPIQQRLRLALDPLILIKPTSLTRRQTIAHRRKYGPVVRPAFPASGPHRHQPAGLPARHLRSPLPGSDRPARQQRTRILRTPPPPPRARSRNRPRTMATKHR
ncbi:TniQ family protein [Streptomyces griseoruber]